MINFYEKFFSVKLIGDRKKSLGQYDQRVFVYFDILIVVFLSQHAVRSVQQNCTKYVRNPAKTMQKRRSNHNHQAPKQHSSDDAPKQNPVLVFLRYPEVSKDHRDNKNIVDTQGLFNQITRQIGNNRLLPRHGRTIFVHPMVFIGEINKDAEQERNGNPNSRPTQGFFGTDGMRIFIKNTQIQGE